jgi:hypothetical protein
MYLLVKPVYKQNMLIVKKIQPYLLSSLIAIVVMAGFYIVIKPSVVVAQEQTQSQDQQEEKPRTAEFKLETNKPDPCNGDTREKLQQCLETNSLIGLIQDVLNFLSIGVGVVVVIMIIIGGIQYSASGGNPNTVQEAKKKIYNAIIALLAYIFLYAILQWLVPGGLF